MLKMLQPRLHQYLNQELPMFKLDLEKAEQIANIHWITEKARVVQKNSYFCFVENAKAFDCVDDSKLENS